LIDHGYHPDHLTQELEKRYPQIMRKIKFELSTKPSKQEKAAAGKSGVCSSNRSVGNRTVKCLDGALQDPGKEF
jgi:hypothetical protein